MQTTSTVTEVSAVSVVSKVSKESKGTKGSGNSKLTFRTKTKIPTKSSTAITGRKLDSAETQKLIIGLDFGTTYTG